MIAVNDNLDLAAFNAGETPSPTAAEINPGRLQVITPERRPGAWFLAQFSARGVDLIAAQPHPFCPPWDGTTPQMSGIPTAPKRRRPDLSVIN